MDSVVKNTEGRIEKEIVEIVLDRIMADHFAF